MLVLVRDGMLDDEHVWLLEIQRKTIFQVVEIRIASLDEFVQLWRAHQVDPRLFLAEVQQALCGVLVRREMKASELAHCVPSNPIDIAAQFARLDVSDGRVRVRAGDGAHELLPSVASKDDPVGGHSRQDIDERDQEQAERLRHREMVIAIDRHVDLIAYLKTILSDKVDTEAVLRQQVHIGHTNRRLDFQRSRDTQHWPDVTPLTTRSGHEEQSQRASPRCPPMPAAGPSECPEPHGDRSLPRGGAMEFPFPASSTRSFDPRSSRPRRWAA